MLHGYVGAMDLATFERRALAYWNAIPARYREGVSQVVVEHDAFQDPETFGEGWLYGMCEADPVVSVVPDAPVVSRIRLFYGSFVEIAADEGPDFDWEEELWETLRHELQHHLEWRAGGDEMGEEEELERENERRMNGEPFQVGYHRAGLALGRGAYLADDTLFVETALSPDAWAALAHDGLAVTWDGQALSVPPVPPELLEGDVLYLPVDEALLARFGPLPWGDACLVATRRPAATAWFTADRGRPSLPDAGFVAGLVLLALVPFGFLAGTMWLAELFTPWRPHHGILLVVAGIAAWPRWRVPAVGFALTGLLLASAWAPRWMGAPPGPGGPADLSVLVWNLYRPQADPDAAVAWLATQDVDVLVVLEVDDRWVEALAALDAEWPHRLDVPRLDNFGLAVRSRVPWSAHDLVEVGPFGGPAARLAFPSSHGGAPLTLVATHTMPPETPWSTAQRGRTLARVGQLAASSARVLVVGDLNVTPWSPHLQRTLTRSGLRDGGTGSGVTGTWPAVLGPFGIPIDHALVGPDVRVADYDVLAGPGSDHRALRVRVRW